MRANCVHDLPFQLLPNQKVTKRLAEIDKGGPQNDVALPRSLEIQTTRAAYFDFYWFLSLMPIGTLKSVQK